MKSWFQFNDEPKCLDKKHCKYNHTITLEFVMRYCITHKNMHIKLNPNNKGMKK